MDNASSSLTAYYARQPVHSHRPIRIGQGRHSKMDTPFLLCHEMFALLRFSICWLASTMCLACIRPGYKIFIIRLTHANVWESMGKLSSCMQFIKSRIFLLQVTRDSVLVLQVTWESVSGTASHARIRIRYYKSRVLRLNVQWNWRFAW